VKEIPADEFAARLHALRGSIKAVLRSYGIPPADAEDVVQDVLLIVVRKWDRIESFEPFVIGVTLNRCRLWLARCLSKRKRLSSLEDLREELPIPPEQLAVERALRLEEVLAPLRPKERQALKLRSLGLTHEQIGAALGLAASGARKLYTRALHRIKALQRGTGSPTPTTRRK
jgi:RNA polymerase sigma-70 factor (ECF subfamily)